MNVSKVIHDSAIAVGAVATTVLTTVPDAAMTVWTSSPEIIKAIVPEEYTPIVSGVLTLLVAVSRLIKFKKGAN